MSNFDLPWWWYALAVCFAAMCCLPAVCVWLEARADRIDREAWQATYGGSR